MTIEIIEKLAPHLAWPIAALLMFCIAAPIVNQKLAQILKAIDELKAMPSSLNKTITDFQPVANEFTSQTKSIQSQIDDLQKNIRDTLTELGKARVEMENAQSQLASTQASLAEERISVDTQAISKLVGTPDQIETSSDDNLEEMHAKLIGKWMLLQRELEARTLNAGLEFDPKKPGSSAVALTDRRRRNYLTREQADLITRLGRQFRKFQNLADQKEDWLSLETYSAFIQGVDSAREAIRHGYLANSEAVSTGAETHG